MASSNSWIQARVWLTVALGLRVLATWFAHELGFSAISDDDFARVAIAQTFTHEPRWDPSGTSWLPFPFWLTGAVMSVWSTDWSAAKGLAGVTSIGSVLAFYACCHAAGLRGFWLGLGACLFAVLPHAVWLGGAPVPEGYTAVLALAGLCTVTASLPLRTVGAGCLLLATLSRYEAWPIALLVAGYHGRRALVDEPGPRGKTHSWRHAALALICVAGPLAWMAHGLFHHDDALFFVKRVADYRAALGASPNTWLAVVANYPKALVVEEPVLAAFVVSSTLLARYVARRRQSEAHPGQLSHRAAKVRALLLWGVLAQVAFLVWGDVTNGAPTHHPERTLLTCWLAALVACLQGLQASGSNVGGPRSPRAVSGSQLLLALTSSCLVGAGLWWMLPSKHFTDRTAELALGRELAKDLGPRARLLLETEGYGHIAVAVGTRRPAWVDGYSPGDPRQTHLGAPWRDPPALETFLRERQVAFVVAPESRWKVLAPLTVALADFGSSKIFRTRWSTPSENSEPRAD